MARVGVNVSVQGLRQIQMCLSKADSFKFLRKRFVHEILRRRPAIVKELKRRTPAQTGELRNGATVKGGKHSATMGYTAYYAKYVRYRRPRFGAKTTWETLRKYGRSRGFRQIMYASRDAALEKLKRDLRKQGCNVD